MGSSEERAPCDARPIDPLATSLTLLHRIKANDGEAWSLLIDLYAPLVYRWCRGWGLPAQEVEDVFQEVFRAVATHIGDFRHVQSEDTFRGWLRMITLNKVRDHFRSRNQGPAATGGSTALLRLASLPAVERTDESGVDQTVAPSLQLALDRAYGEFEDRTWKAFWLTAVEGQATADVAQALDMRTGAVRVAKARVLRRLRQLMGEQSSGHLS
jgi:RNA polymerase sigma-70 factor (ECF subfamily)